jgi:hypothetical protein
MLHRGQTKPRCSISFMFSKGQGNKTTMLRLLSNEYGSARSRYVFAAESFARRSGRADSAIGEAFFQLAAT